jgi:hypothetical protein
MPTYYLQLNVSIVPYPKHGTVITSGPYEKNSTPTITAIPDAGWAFQKWTGDVGCNDPLLPTSLSHTILMDSNKTCLAYFVPALSLPATPMISVQTAAIDPSPYRVTDHIRVFGYSSCGVGNSTRFEYRWYNSPPAPPNINYGPYLYDAGTSTSNFELDWLPIYATGYTSGAYVKVQCYNTANGTLSNWSAEANDWAWTWRD